MYMLTVDLDHHLKQKAIIPRIPQNRTKEKYNWLNATSQVQQATSKDTDRQNFNRKYVNYI